MKYLPHHTAISVRDLNKTLVFYKALGFKQVHRYDDPDKIGVKLKLGDYFLEIFAYEESKTKPELRHKLGGNLNEPGLKHIALTTDDIDAALAELRAQGLANSKTKILTKDGARFFFIKDPYGMWVEFIKDNRYS
jgi:catechol 2,3-dioxygenase-like lactoylglutathione lyase family enzyme